MLVLPVWLCETRRAPSLQNNLRPPPNPGDLEKQPRYIFSAWLCDTRPTTCLSSAAHVRLILGQRSWKSGFRARFYAYKHDRNSQVQTATNFSGGYTGLARW